MRRIGLFLGIGPEAGGMFQYTQSILQAVRDLAVAGTQVEIACAHPAWLPELANDSLPVTHLWWADFGIQMAYAATIARIPGNARLLMSLCNPIAYQLRRLRCDLWIFPAQDPIAYQVRERTLVAVHDLMHRYEPFFSEVADRRRYGIREHRFRNLMTRACGVLVDSDVGRRHVVESYGVDPNKVYPLPYIPPRHILNAHEPPGFDRRYALPPKFLFYPAKFWAHKNHHVLVSAAATLKDKLPDLHFVFAGAHDHGYEALRAHASMLGMLDRIVFPGHVPDEDLAGFYRRARALVMPTYFGPTNIPPLEAMACDCPVAVSRIYAMPEQYGDAAIYFDPRSVTEIADVIEKLWVDDALCERLKERGRAKTAAWGQAAFDARLAAIVDSVLNASSQAMVTAPLANTAD